MSSMLRRLAPFALASVAACAHQQQAARPAAAAPAAAATVAATTSSPAAGTCSSDLDCGSKQLCIRAACVDITPDLAECRQQSVAFEFNDAQIRESDRSQLQRMARCLKADSGMHVRIEGNADERGTEEYNMALGEQRARTVGSYLGSLGVSEAQRKTVSYGKEQPICSEHDEACWSKNRRAAIKPSDSPSTKRHGG